jgi:hypothetical protein
LPNTIVPRGPVAIIDADAICGGRSRRCHRLASSCGSAGAGRTVGRTNIGSPAVVVVSVVTGADGSDVEVASDVRGGLAVDLLLEQPFATARSAIRLQSADKPGARCKCMCLRRSPPSISSREEWRHSSTRRRV